MRTKKIERKLKKHARKLLRLARKADMDRADVYVNAESGFMHCYVMRDGVTTADVVDWEDRGE